MHRLFRFISVLTSLLFAAVASADATIGDPFTGGSNPSAGHSFFGETFVVPAGETGISSINLIARRGTSSQTTASIELYNWDDGTNSFVGGPLYSSPVSGLVVGDNPIADTPNFAVVPGQVMAVVVNWHNLSPGDIGTYYRTTNTYTGGHLIFGDNSTGEPVTFPPEYDIAFSMNFGPIPEPSIVAAMLPLLALVRRPRA